MRRAVFARLVANGLAQATAAVAAALLLRSALDQVRDGSSVVALLPEVSGLCGAGLAVWGLRMREAADAERLAQSYLKSVRLTLFQHLNVMPSRVLQRRTRGVMMVRFVADLNAIGLWVGHGFARAITAGPAVLVALGALAWVSPAVGAAVIGVVAVGAVITMLLVPTLYRRTRAMRRRRGQLAANLGEMLSAATPVQVFGRVEGEGERLGRRADRLSLATTSLASIEGGLRALPEAAMPAAMAGAILVIAVSKPGADAAGSLAAIVLLLGLLATSLRDLSLALAYRQGYRAARDVLLGFLALAPLPSGPPLRAGPGRVEFDAVDVKGSLHQVSAVAEPRQLVVVVGPSGAGKSSLLALASRLFDPDAGEVRLDGQTLAGHDLQMLRCRVGMVSPELSLLRGSVRRNVSYRAPSASPQKVQAALELCGLTDAVAALPRGLDTRLTEAGSELPAGLRRRIALARAILDDPPVLLVDDADTFADPSSRAALDRVVDRRASTILLVTHDPAWLERADVAWHMEAGRLVVDNQPGQTRPGQAEKDKIRQTPASLATVVPFPSRREGVC